MHRLSLLILIALVTCSFVRPQDIPKLPIPPETTAALDQIDKAFDLNLKGWTRERVKPFQPSSGLEEIWKTSGRSVKIFIGKRRPSTTELDKKPTPGMEPIEGICDEATMFGYDGNISCRHGEFGISISSAANFTLFQKNGGMINQEEAKATSRLIACFVNLALDGKLSVNWPHRDKPIFQRPCELELAYRGLIGEEIMKSYRERY